MTLTLELAPETETALQQAAQTSGQSLTEYVGTMLEHWARVSSHVTDPTLRAEVAARLAALDELDAYLRTLPDYRTQAGLGPLPDDAVEDAYREREDAQL